MKPSLFTNRSDAPSDDRPGADPAPEAAALVQAKKAAKLAKMQAQAELQAGGAAPQMRAEPQLTSQAPLQSDYMGKAKPRRLRRGLFVAANIIGILIPTAVTAIYLFAFANDIYVTDTSFSVRRAGEASVSGAQSLFAQAFGGIGMGGNESFAVVEFVRSREAMHLLDATYGLRARWSDPAVDFVRRLSPDADDEDLYDYYTSRIDISYDEVSGLITLETQDFSPELSLAMAETLQSASEALVNEFNKRAEEDMLNLAQQEVRSAQDALQQAQTELTRYRTETQAIDPTVVTGMVTQIITALQTEIALAKAKIRELGNFSQKDTPQLRELHNRLDALEAQVVEEQQRLTGPDNALAEKIETYSVLVMHEELARQALVATLEAREAAIANARRQQLYVINVVPARLQQVPRLPDKAETLLFVFIGSIVCWVGIRLTYSAIRDHAL